MNEIRKYIVDELVVNYRDGVTNRREALARIAAITGSAAIAASMLSNITPVAAQTTPADAPPGVRVPENDPDPGGDGDVSGARG